MEVAGWFVGPIMDEIIKACSDYLKDQIRWQTGMMEELERLQENHPKIKAVVFAANQAQISNQNPGLNEWIWQLRDALDEVNDVLDELEYMKHKEQLSKNTEEAKLIKNKKLRKVRSMMKSMKTKLNKIGKRDPNLKRLEKAVQKLDKVSADVTPFFLLLESAKQEQKEQEVDFYKTRQTGSLPTTNVLFGRGEAKEYVTQWLKKLSNEHQDRNISLLSIVGHGGMGKTTLLQHVYKDEITEEFDLKMWVCVSNNFDMKTVIEHMLESLYKKKPDVDSLDALQDMLRIAVGSKKFLLILDDIWEEEEYRDISKWEKVLAPLAYGKIGSGILVTTRMDSVATMIAKVIKTKKETFKLERLEEDQCLQLLNSHAFAGVEIPPSDHKKLKAIAGEIVKKLSGSPLAAKVIGGVLNSSLNERHWTKVLNSDFISPKSGQDDIFLILRLSYTFLPKHLQNCFAFCSIFPQDYKFDKDYLVKIWIALGFIQQPHDQEWTIEDIGGSYFDELVKKSFFDKFDIEFTGCYYKMHDLIHALAQSVSMHECLRVEDGTKLPSIIPKTLRHLYVETTNLDIIKKIGQVKYLHSLFLIQKASNQDICSALIEIFKASRSLRLLYVNAPALEMLPEEIGNLIHLRYLRIFHEKFTMLPRSLSTLYHLQYLRCEKLGEYQHIVDFLPCDINNLSNLCYLLVSQYNISFICGIGKLKFLQELNINLKDVSGYGIGELENMNDLCKLSIYCLENIKNVEEACSAKLRAKTRLTDLTLCWSNTDSRNIDLDENVLDNLQPPTCLRNLSINRYMGVRSAIWMNVLNNLEQIKLSDCLECESLPPFGQLPFLKSLVLRNMPKVKWLGSQFNGNDKYHAFPLLEKLFIWGLKALEDWFEAGVAAEDGCLFPCLTKLYLYDCPKLKELPSLPSKLKSLQIRSTAWTNLNFCSNSNPIPLETLAVCDCPNITSLPLADELAALRHLEIRDCPNLISLGRNREVETANNFHLMLSNLSISDPLVLLMEPLRSIASLTKLSISNNDEPVSFPNEAEQWFLKVRSSLSELEFSDLESLESLPFSLESLSSLRKLSIRNCPNLISLGRNREVETTNNCPLILDYLCISDPSVLLMEPLRSIASLKTLIIENNDELVSFPNEAEQWFLKVRSSLSVLNFRYLASLDSLPSFLESLSSLQNLNIGKVPMLRELPNLPPSLESLSIWGKCHPELKERYRKDGGSDRHKIAHIPSINIDID
ncbi:hypothetical protein KFK09_002210 [Dendrobium nobile]|uniref:Uncharacterized protein n=1 Tax=Dendrobium nobile TaxID=94219 RepID=A0A8T3C6Y0_DENNO|nr:hypothetical protein KFK09_002210 [Dendrobium nobile]